MSDKVETAADVQIPVLAALLLVACATKILRAIRTRSVAPELGPVALFPTRLRTPLAILVYSCESVLGVGLIVTWDDPDAPAILIRLATGLFFLVGTSALIELRSSRPDLSCGCFGDFSTAPVSRRALARSALLAIAAFSTLGAPDGSSTPDSHGTVVAVVVVAVELLVLAALSPELGEALVRLGYSEPCELHAVPAERTLAILRRSRHWRRHARLIVADSPTDVWRELCWRYLVFPARYDDRNAEIVFAVFLEQRRPVIRAALVDGATGLRVPWPARTPPWRRVHAWRPTVSGSWRPRGLAAATAPPASQADMPVSSEL